jgi:hypothetical protein
MAKRIGLAESASRRLTVKASATRRVSIAAVAKGLGAEVVARAPARSGSPADFAAIREEVFRRLRSTGGRPGLEGAQPKKIPLSDEDWKRVERVADHISEPGFKPSVGQVAGVLLSIVLRDVDTSLEAAVKRDLKVSSP